MFRKILIANRGEIAVRIIRACRELGLGTVAIYSEVDRDSLHVRLADQSICIGQGPSSKSYLNIPNIISAASITGADAIHPGYGFLAENSHFAEICQSHQLVFIGPPPEAIEKMGDKAVAKKTMAQAGVPVIPGSEGAVKDEKEAKKMAAEIGYPIIIKASAGGGGRGMRVVFVEKDFSNFFQMAQAEAESAFGNPEVYLEKFIEEPRHIEMQVLVDKDGNGVYLGERDCSIQRRHQKVLEEALSPAITPSLREKMGGMAVTGALAANYVNAGTIEFLLDKYGRFYFMEMNTRIQVEHPVTELITGIDLVKEQIRIAAGDHLGYQQSDVIFNGHAIECRINAEDPEKNFMPSPGKIAFYHAPGGIGVRVDSAVYTGYIIPSYYDSMVAKLIAWGLDRDEAVRRMHRALREMEVDGVKTTIPFHLKVLENEHFLKGEIDTGFIGKYMAKEQ
ncbi:MAG: acetyl-CoA carboxylase biotin carboxylase subunit [Bacillota bacterium]